MKIKKFIPAFVLSGIVAFNINAFALMGTNGVNDVLRAGIKDFILLAAGSLAMLAIALFTVKKLPLKENTKKLLYVIFIVPAIILFVLLLLLIAF